MSASQQTEANDEAKVPTRSRMPLPDNPQDMYMVVKGAETWKAFANTLKAINMDKVTCEVGPSGLTSKAQDPSHVNGVALYWPGAAFEKFQCEREVRVTLDVGDLVKIFSRASKDDDLVFLAPIGLGAAPDSLSVALVGAYLREFSLHWYESPPPGERQHVALDPQVRAVLNKPRLGSIMGDIEAVSDRFYIHANTSGIVFKPKGDPAAGISKAMIEQMRTDPTTGSIEILGEKPEVDGLYNVLGLKLALEKLGTIAETVMVEFATNRPMVITANLNTLGATMKFLTAPRITEFDK